jgi:hypothetical protein
MYLFTDPERAARLENELGFLLEPELEYDIDAMVTLQ